MVAPADRTKVQWGENLVVVVVVLVVVVVVVVVVVEGSNSRE